MPAARWVVVDEERNASLHDAVARANGADRRCCTARSSALVEGNDSRNFASATASAHDAFQSLTGSAISAVTRRRQSGGCCGNQYSSGLLDLTPGMPQG